MNNSKKNAKLRKFPHLILASQSQQRKIMMDAMLMHYSDKSWYEIMPADIDELAITGSTQYERVALVAQAKGREIVKKSDQNPTAILAADTYLVDAGDQALEKPNDLLEAAQMLAHQSGSTITAYTGVFWFDTISNQEVIQTYQTEVTFRNLAQSEIDMYVRTQPVTTFSGAFCPAYPSGAALIEKISGSFTSFTYGFPVEFFAPKIAKYIED